MKQFKPTSWAIDNRTSIYIITIIITLFGIIAYNNLQKEKFPDIVIPTVFVGTAYPGTSPSDMENLVTRPIEKQLKSISGVKRVKSTSVQDFSSISVEFNTDVDVADAKQKVKDAVDKARTDLPNDLPRDPDVQDINFSEIPIMFVHVSGDFELDKLKKYAEDLQDKIETIKEITRVDMVGALDKEIQIDADMYKMQVAKVTFSDIERAISTENMTISGGTIRTGEMKRAIRVVGQYSNPDEIGNIVIKSASGAPIYLKDIADVREGYKEKESFARLDNKPVITLNVVKRSGENLVSASDKVQEAVKEMEKEFPKGLKITITGDQSTQTRNTLNDLINTIIIGFILVTLILMFFMGTTNALFVGLSIPISTFLVFLVMPGIGFSLNMIVLFSFLLALGIVVDDAIVVIENTHRVYNSTKLTIAKAAKYAAGEVFLPVFAGTATTLAPFVPLSFWPGVVGEFMFYMPVTLIIVLSASLVVAFLINPVFAVTFMGKDEVNGNGKPKSNKKFWYWIIGLEILALLFYLAGNTGIGNLINFIIIFIFLNKYVFTGWIYAFQHRLLPAFMTRYEKLLRWILKGNRPWAVFAGIFLLLIFSIFLTAVRAPKVVFFPMGDPNFIYAYLNLPVGTDQTVTDSVTRVVEQKVFQVLGKDNPNVESVIANVAVGAGDPMEMTRNAASNKGKVTVAFKEFQHRTGEHSTQYYLDQVREVVKDIPGVEIAVEQERNGPPTGKPVNIEVSGDDFPTLIKLAKEVERYIENKQVAGIEDLRSDMDANNPEIMVNVDRVRANREGISTAQIGGELRTAIFGKEASKFKRDEDEFPIQVRYSKYYRENLDALMDLRITYRDMNSGLIKQIPLSAVATVDYTNTYGGIKRKNMKRVITLSSNVLSGYNPNEVVANITNSLKGFKTPDGFEVKMTGEQEDQQETMDFLSLAGLLAFGLIFLILVLQFNSFSKPIIIITEIFFSIIGVLLGFAIFKMDISIVMTGVGMIALAGIVVKNGILIVEFSDELKARGHKTVEAIVQAGKTRLNPVLLTAASTVIGLIPLAFGVNINFFTLFSEFDPQFYTGGESMTFWGPLAWTIIFGLSFATIITLLIVPVMYLISYRWKVVLRRKNILPSKAE